MIDDMIFQIDFSGDEALYQQLMNYIIVGIATGQIRQGDSLPSVRQMADSIGINMHTVNKAYGQLRQQGFVSIDRRHGAIVDVEKSRELARQELSEALSLALARCTCRKLSREDVHELVDKIYDSYEERE